MSAHCAPDRDEELEGAADAQPELVRAPTVPPFRPLQRRVNSIVPRNGAFDYRNSPSLMGGQRVPYRTQT